MTYTCDQGDLVRSSAAFTTAAGAAQDPTVVICKVKIPAGTITTYTYLTDVALVRDSAGNYHLDVNAATAGTYWVRWYSTGTGQAAEEEAFVVQASQVV
jgi:hypothetical protein